MTNEEAIRYWENLRKTFSEHMEKETNPFGKMHYQTSIEAINVAVAALKANHVGSEPLTLDQLRKMDGQPVKVEMIGESCIENGCALVDVYDRRCINEKKRSFWV